MRHLIITGGTGSLGSVIVQEFLGRGWKVNALSSLDLNLLNEKEVFDFFERNPCDLLICAAGMIRDIPLLQMTENDWLDVFSINYTAAKNCVLAALPWMLSKKRGHVIFISSYAAKSPFIGQSAYATAKASLHDFSHDLSVRYGSLGLRFNVLLPGFLETNMTKFVSEKRKCKIREDHALKEFNTIEITAKFIKFLDETLIHTSGQIFQLDSRI